MNHAAASRTIEITVLSAENLRRDGKPVKKDSFVVVKIDPYDQRSTRADYEGGSHPSWNEKLVMDMPIHACSIALEVRCKVGSATRVIGTASLPVSDFLGTYTPENYLHFLSYRLRDPRGERNGIVNVSVLVKSSPSAEAVRPAAATRKNVKEFTCNSTSTSPKPQLGVPVGVAVGEKNGHGYSGVVTGIPVWCASRA